MVHGPLSLIVLRLCNRIWSTCAKLEAKFKVNQTTISANSPFLQNNDKHRRGRRTRSRYSHLYPKRFIYVPSTFSCETFRKSESLNDLTFCKRTNDGRGSITYDFKMDICKSGKHNDATSQMLL